MRLSHLTDAEIQGLLDFDREATVGLSEARAHLDACTACQEELAVYRDVVGEIACCNVPPLPSDFANRVMDNLPPLPGFEPWRTALRIGSTVAAWLIALIIVAVPLELPDLSGLTSAVGEMLALMLAPIWELSVSAVNAVTSQQAGWTLMVLLTLLLYFNVDRMLFRTAYRRLES